MAELPRYTAPRVAPQTGRAVAARVEAQAYNTLADRIGSFEGIAMKQYAKTVASDAKKDAAEAFAQRGLKAEINEDMTLYGETYTSALSNMHKKKLAIDTGVAVEGAYKLNEDNPLGFKAATEEIYKNTSGLLPDHLKADYAIDFEANKAHYEGQVFNNRINADKQADLALTNTLYAQSSDNASRASRDGNYDLFMYEMEKATAALDSALVNKTITPDAHRKGVDDLKFNTSSSMFKGINDKHLKDGDLQGSNDYIESFRTSQPDGFNDKQRESLADEMQGELNGVIKQQKVKADAVKVESGIVVKDAMKVLKSGKRPQNMRAVDAAASLLTVPQQHEYEVAKEAQNIIEKFSFLTLPEQMAKINEVEAQPTSDRVSVEALTQVKKDLSAKMTMAEKDPYSLGVQDGIYEQSGVLIPSQGLQAVAQHLPTRATQSRMAQSAYGTAPKLFTDAEAQGYTAWLDNPSTPIDDKLDFITTIEKSAPNESMAVYRQLNEKGASVFAFAGSMVKKGDRQKAEKMLRGQMILREQPGVVPKEMTWELNAKLGNVMRYQGAGARKALIEANTAYYAASAEDQGKLSANDYDGDIVDLTINDTTNGIGKMNDQNYFLPSGADEDDVDDWVENLTVDDFSNVSGVSASEAVDIVNRGQLISSGNGKYQVMFQGRRLMAQDGKPLIMEYTK